MNLRTWSRNGRLGDVLDSRRLDGLPDEVKHDWQVAADYYRHQTDRVAESREQEGIEPPVPLPLFVHDGLKKRLTAMGIHDDPEDILVDVHDFSAAYFYNPTGKVDASALGPVRGSLAPLERPASPERVVTGAPPVARVRPVVRPPEVRAPDLWVPGVAAPVSLPGGREVSFMANDRWPDTVWIYPPVAGRFPAVDEYRSTYMVGQDGVRGVRMSTLPPEAYAATQPRRRTIRYVKVNLRALHERYAREGRLPLNTLARIGPADRGQPGTDVRTHYLLDSPGSRGLVLQDGEFTQGLLVDVHRLSNGMTRGIPSYRHERVRNWRPLPPFLP